MEDSWKEAVPKRKPNRRQAEETRQKSGVNRDLADAQASANTANSRLDNLDIGDVAGDIPWLRMSGLSKLRCAVTHRRSGQLWSAIGI